MREAGRLAFARVKRLGRQFVVGGHRLLPEQRNLDEVSGYR